VVEAPLGRSLPPDQLIEVMPVLLVADPAAFRGEIELVPPLELGLGRQRHFAGFLVADQVSADGDERSDPLWPKRRADAGRSPAPVEAGENRLVDPERIHEVNDIDGHSRRLAVAKRLAGKK